MENNVKPILEEWEKLIDELSSDEEKLKKTKRYYDDREMDILMNTDFNKIYNKNNDKFRKHHIRKKLKNTSEQKEQLELKIEDSKRRISFLKASAYAEIELMKYKFGG